MPALFEPTRALTLASASPRRKSLLQEAGLDLPVVLPSQFGPFSEPAPQTGERPEAYVLRTALAKASAVAVHSQENVILAADTVVVLPETQTILGKPADEAHALTMLRLLNGRSHHVITGCAICWNDGTLPRQELFADTATVTFAAWPEPVLAAYACCGEPLDKAGAYAVQGAGSFLIAGITGSWSTVVGLPMPALIQRLLRLAFIRPTSQTAS
ncbi:MAG TPA: septum formation protein Maf [Candidatus Avidesulfovibrio excrementigallinarum]|nr:septum formation protein Maf [Candidatus Avidesulfovibrio excrementigallinarum]